MSATKDFLAELNTGILLGDGAIGTELFTRGVALETGVERLNLLNPGIVRTLHRDYIAAGSRVIETNTFQAARPNLMRYGAERETPAIITAGVQLAREVAGGAYVAGSVGPLSPVEGEPLGREAQDTAFSEHIDLLLQGGVDLIILETFVDLDQLVTAITTARRLTGIPVIAQMAFERGGISAGGDRADQFVQRAIDAGADVIGANCGGGAASVIGAIDRIAPFGVPMSAYMNAGFAEQAAEGRKLYRATDDYMAKKACELAGMGVSLIGGCCGTGPGTIAAMATVLASAARPCAPEHRPVIMMEPARPAEPETPPARHIPRGVLVELDPPRNLDIAPILTAAHELKKAGAAGITLADNPLASVRADVLTVAGIIRRETGLHVVPHLTGRDRNRIALQSAIMGAHLIGIRSLLCVTGDPVRMYHETNTSGVFDVTSIGLIKLVADFNEGRRLNDGERTAFSIGVALNPNVRSIGGQVQRLGRKMDAGAQFALTQPIFDTARLDMLKEALDRANMDIPIYLGIMPLTSAKNANFLHFEVPGIAIPDSIRTRLSSLESVADQRAAARDAAIELVEAAADHVHGFYFITPRNRANYVLPLVEAANRLMKRD